MPAWLEFLVGLLLVVGGVWKGFFVELEKVGQVPEDVQGSIVLAAEWRDAQVTTSCLWTAAGVLSGIGLVVHSTGRMVFGW